MTTQTATNYDLSTDDGMANAVRWTNNLLDSIKTGGVWMVPRCASWYTVDHETKTLTRSGLRADPAITRVLKAGGWNVID